MGFAAHVTPHLGALEAEPTTHLQRLRTPYLHLDVLGMEVLQHAMCTACGSGALFSCVDHCGGADRQHARGLAHATRVEGPIDDLLLDGRRGTGLGIRQQKKASMPFKARTAPRALPAFRR